MRERLSLARDLVAVLLGVFDEPTPDWANRLATWLTIAAAVLGLIALLLALVSVPEAVLPAGQVQAIRKAEERADDEEPDGQGGVGPPAATRATAMGAAAVAAGRVWSLARRSRGCRAVRSGRVRRCGVRPGGPTLPRLAHPSGARWGGDRPAAGAGAGQTGTHGNHHHQ